MHSQVVNFLVVDDDPVDVRAIKRGFAKQKITNPIVVAHDGVEALDVLRGANGARPMPKPFVILLDLNMPRMNGIEFLHELREDETLSSSVVFVLTTSSHDEDKVAAYKQHIAGYILKSDAGDDFLDLVKLLDQFSIVVQLPVNPQLES